MNRSRNFLCFTLVTAALLWAFLELRINANAPMLPGGGADVIVGDMPDVDRYGPVGNEVAYSVATTSCNIGDVPLNWFANTNQHPVISQNVYRVKDGRLEHLGQSWLKHGFAALTQNLCDTCQNPGSSQLLGVGCSDPYGASLNGSHSRLGPKSEVNAATGFYPMPHHELTGAERTTLGGRIKVTTASVDPNQNPGARWFVSSQYVTPDDTAAGNSTNSASYREVFPTASLQLNVSGASPTVRMLPAIHAWKAVHPDVQLTTIDIPGDGRIVVGIRTTEDGNGFHTEVAIQNQTSDRCVGGLDVRCDSGSVSNPGFNDVDYQFEPYASTDWPANINGSEVSWETETFAQNQNANAIRWGTTYSFWLDSDERPSELEVHLFEPGSPSGYTLDVSGTVVPDSYDQTDGIYVSGDITDLQESDDQDLVIRNFGAGEVVFEIKGTSPVEDPSVFEICFESKVSPILSNVDQTVELYNYNNQSWVEVDTRRAERINDGVVEFSASGNLARFVEDGTNCVEARIRYKSTNPRRRFTSENDQFKWTIVP